MNRHLQEYNRLYDEIACKVQNLRSDGLNNIAHEYQTSLRKTAASMKSHHKASVKAAIAVFKEFLKELSVLAN